MGASGEFTKNVLRYDGRNLIGRNKIRFDKTATLNGLWGLRLLLLVKDIFIFHRFFLIFPVSHALNRGE